MGKKREILRKCENLMIAIQELEDSEHFGAGSDKKIKKLKDNFKDFKQHVKKLRKKIK